MNSENSATIFSRGMVSIVSRNGRCPAAQRLSKSKLAAWEGPGQLSS